MSPPTPDEAHVHDFWLVPAETQQKRLKISTIDDLQQKTPVYDGNNAAEKNDDAIDAALADGEVGAAGNSEWVHSIKPMHIGLAALRLSKEELQIGYSVNDGVYSIDFSVRSVNQHADNLDDEIASRVVEGITDFSSRHLVKFVSAGISSSLVDLCPRIPSLLWARLDILPFVMPAVGYDAEIAVDELADSMVRKAVMWIGPQEMPRLSIVSRNMVDVDGGGIRICDLQDYQASAGDAIWRAVNKLCKELIAKKTKIAFFSATPQGGGVALMRHALIRFFRLMGVSAHWYVPKPNPAVFRITKTNHNILQGVADPATRLSDADKATFSQWITNNAERYWFRKGGPLAEGGADVVFVDDPQMVGLIPMIKKVTPDKPVVYRSHIEIRSDLTQKKGSPQAGVWDFLWDSIQHCDLFIAHPVSGFVPSEVPISKVGMMPATTDWLDGLNKPMAKWDVQYYFRKFAQLCEQDRMAKLDFPGRGYICQVARFDPSKGIPDVIDSYRKLRGMLEKEGAKHEDTPQLLICGHGAIDDPDGTLIYDQTLKSLEHDDLKEYKNDIVVMRLGPSDQMLNTLLSHCRVALQLSHREGFEVKISEALHKSIPVVAYRAGGIPLQIQHGRDGYLVETGDTDGVARHLRALWLNEGGVYDRLREAARCMVSDEVGTVGNAACWAYLGSRLARGEKVEPGGRWVYDMMREEAGEPFGEGEARLPRKGIEVQADGA